MEMSHSLCYIMHYVLYNLNDPRFSNVLQHQPPVLFQQCVMDERWWTPQHPPCEDQLSSSGKLCKQSYITTCPESGVSDIKEDDRPDFVVLEVL